jgi:addiction module RelE/StbE family toxin
MRIVVSPQARADLRDIFLYITADDPAAARTLLERIRSCIAGLKDAPHLGRPGRVPGTRELIIAGTPYIIPYQVSGDQLQILRVHHGARQWPARFD